MSFMKACRRSFNKCDQENTNGNREPAWKSLPGNNSAELIAPSRRFKVLEDAHGAFVETVPIKAITILLSSSLQFQKISWPTIYRKWMQQHMKKPQLYLIIVQSGELRIQKCKETH